MTLEYDKVIESMAEVIEDGILHNYTAEVIAKAALSALQDVMPEPVSVAVVKDASLYRLLKTLGR